MFDGNAVARSKLSEILARLRQTKAGIWAAAHTVGVMVVLTIVLPETHRTKLKTTASAQCKITAARATICGPFLHWLVDVLKGRAVSFIFCGQVIPRPSCGCDSRPDLHLTKTFFTEIVL